MMVDLLQAMDAHRVQPVIDRVYGFDEANEALDYFRRTGKVGKVMIRV